MIKVGDKFNCYDDGKVRPSRHTIITITDIIPKKKWNEDQKNLVYNVCEDSDLFDIRDQNKIIIGIDSNGKASTFLETSDYPGYFSAEYWGAGRLDVTGEYTDNLITSLNNGVFDYTDEEIKYIIHCLINKENIDWDKTKSNNPTKVIKDILSNIS